MTVPATSIIDNREGNTLLARLESIGNSGRQLDVAAAFFSLDALLLLADTLEEYDRIRILFGDDASPRQRKALLQQLRRASDQDLVAQREKLPLLTALQKVEALFVAGRVEARCYTRQKFHAKAYVVNRESYPPQMGIIGSGNFTRPGLQQNIELNVELTPEQTAALQQWYEERWEEAAMDVVTEDLLAEIRRQIDLYDPHYLYLKALYAWGQDRQGDGTAVTSLYDILDEHQRQGYLQALRILERQHGVMVCDGVGLGKSFIALALMEHFCRLGMRVLLLAPKNIMANSWWGYLDDFLGEYREPFGSIDSRAMTELGFDLEELEEALASGEGISDSQQRSIRLVRKYAERADVVVVDESHNFRTRSANRYQNLYRIIEPHYGKRKQVILLTATPINTRYEDMSAQLGLITHGDGTLAGYSLEQIRKSARELDRDLPANEPAGQLSLTLNETPNETLNRVLEQVIIQRSRTTCKALSEAAGKELRFPHRNDPKVIDYAIGTQHAQYAALIDLTEERFRPAVKYLEDVRAGLEKLKDKDVKKLPKRLQHGPARGIKLAAFLTEQYRRVPNPTSKQYLDEVHLAALVYANALKQLESSPAAFQGIIQSIAVGLLARLKLVFGDAADKVIAEHGGWANTPVFAKPEPDDMPEETASDTLTDGEALDTTGEEPDAWLLQAIRSRGLYKTLREFTPEVFDVERWRLGIEEDLGYLREVHDAIMAARKQPDPKLETVIPVLQRELAEGKRILLFTQSRRTAEYLERELAPRLKGFNVARIDSRVEDTRASIIHAFCPGYNREPSKWSPSVPKRVDVLISTDVLSEGVNLQEAGAILNYDIHWNPVRLIQRIGRVDRRLNPAVTPGDHAFDILNVLPPPEIEKIINLVEAVEQRTLKISRALGIDEAFFKATDPAGTLKEFNRLYEGDMKSADLAATQFTRAFTEPDPELLARLAQLPPGAFGVWDSAPIDGLFAFFTMEATASTTAADQKRFAQIIGRPVLALVEHGKVPLLDAGAILHLLSGTVEGEHSGNPGEEAGLGEQLRRLKDAVRQRFREIGLPRTILPRLVCWMELRKEGR